MAGRRLRKAVKAILDPMVQKEGFKEAVVTISGLCNTYSSYVTTFEEYQAQRYEAASTIFGPHTLSGYIQEFTRLAKDFVTGTKPSATGPAPPDLTDSQIQLMPEARFDMLPYNSTVKFGDVVEGKDVLPSYRLGQNQIAQATFYGANPRNNFKTQSTYMTVEKKGNIKFDVVARDGEENYDS
jgi:neutral ceramidase